MEELWAWERALTTDSERQELLSMWEVREGGVRGSGREG